LTSLSRDALTDSWAFLIRPMRVASIRYLMERWWNLMTTGNYTITFYTSTIVLEIRKKKI
jgi:hypothetical protein